jgi:outer membrane protein, heavy metal efflux system
MRRIPLWPCAVLTMLAGSAVDVASRFADAADTVPAPRETITLEECRSRALSGSPEIGAARHGLAAAQGASRQAGSWPNPEISFEAEDFEGDLPGWSESQVTASIQQRVEPPGAWGARKEAGRWGETVARAELDRTQREILAEVERRFLSLLAAQERALVWAESMESGDSLVATVSALVNSGEASPIEGERARVSRSLLEIELSAAEGEVKSARRTLAALLGEEEPSFREASGDLRFVPIPTSSRMDAGPPPPLPDLAWWEADVRRLEAAARFESRSRLPEFLIGAGYRHIEATQEETYLASIGIELPLFDRNGGAVQEAHSRWRQGQALKRATEISLHSEVASAGEKLEWALAQAQIMDSSIVVESERIARSLNEGYRRGKFGFLDVLDARRGLADARLRSIDRWLAAGLAKVEMERLLGRSLSENEGETK